MPDYALPVDQPQFDAMGNPMPTNATPDYSGINPIVGKLFGVGGNERFQTWPERMVRSGLALPADVYSGREPIIDDSGHTAQPVIERAMDTAGLAGLSSIPLAPKGALGAVGGKFYSTLENTIAGSKVQKATPEQWTSYLKNQPGVKPEELEFSLSNLPEGQITKEQLAQHVADNGIKLGEVWKGENLKEQRAREIATNEGENWDTIGGGQQHFYRDTIKEGIAPKYSSYQLPGGENYRELLMTVPDKHSYETVFNNLKAKYGNDFWEKASPEELKAISNPKESYKSSHWDEPNVLAHIRMNDREVPGVGNTLHVEEIQSDWHQAGRKGGYKDVEPTSEAIQKQAQNIFENSEYNIRYGKKWEDLNASERNYWLKDAKTTLQKEGVPNAPFKKTWDELALKRVLSEAAEKGYDAVSWTPGEAQAARYDLSKTLREVHYQPETGKLMAWQHGRNEAPINIEKGVIPEKLSDYIGKEGAQKILDQETNGQGYKTLKGQELKVGGEGMKAFYDKMLVDKANALIKKMGGKVEYSTDVVMPKLSNKIGEKPEETRIPIIKITPQMRETIANKGFPLYSSGVPTFSSVDNDPWNSKIKLVPVEGNPFL